MEGKNIVIEWRSAEGKLERLQSARRRTSASQGRCHCYEWADQTRAVKEATVTIPIVMAARYRSCWQDSLPAWRDLEETYWISTLRPELSGKQLELLKEIIP